MTFITKTQLLYKVQASDELYIRFGDLPKEGHSHNFNKNVPLKGISVYWSSKKGNMYFVEGDTVHPSFAELVDDYIEHDRPVYLVKGRELDFLGPDREPLILDAKIVKKLEKGEISDHEGKISRALYWKRLDELGGIFGHDEERKAQRAYFKAHAKEYDSTLSWTKNKTLMDDNLLKKAADEWYNN